MTTLGQQIIADNICRSIKSVVGAAIVAINAIEKSPDNAEKEFQQLKEFISIKLEMME